MKCFAGSDREGRERAGVRGGERKRNKEDERVKADGKEIGRKGAREGRRGEEEKKKVSNHIG